MQLNTEKILNSISITCAASMLTIASVFFTSYSYEIENSGKTFEKSENRVCTQFYKDGLERIQVTEKETEDEKEQKISYTDKELDMLSRIIYAEAGSDCISDEHQQLVGIVVINRINDPRFPDTMEEVIMAKGQYDCIRNGSYYKQPSERAIENAKKVLCGEVVAPSNLIYQAEFPQGYEVYKTFDTPWSTTYFCLG